MQNLDYGPVFDEKGRFAMRKTSPILLLRIVEVFAKALAIAFLALIAIACLIGSTCAAVTRTVRRIRYGFIVLATLIASMCTSGLRPLYAQEDEAGASVSVTVTPEILIRWDDKQGEWHECIFPLIVDDYTIRVRLSIPLDSIGKHAQTCHYAPGLAQSDQSGQCELTPQEYAEWKQSRHVIRIVYCGGGLVHKYFQPPKPRIAPDSGDRHRPTTRT